MKLDRVQRWILASQFQILEELAKTKKDKTDQKFYADAREALERGYELEYEHFAQNVYPDTLPTEECKEVLEIMSMFRSIETAYSLLADKSGIKEHFVKFNGFDGNNETRLMTYAKYYCETHDAFEELAAQTTFNSHSPSLELYRRMLAEYGRSADKYKLTKDDLVRITNVV